MLSRFLFVRRRALAIFLPALASLAISVNAAPGCLNSGDLTFNAGGNLAVDIDGTTVCTEYDQIDVSGSVTIDPSATLSVDVTGYVTPSDLDSFVIINNDGTEPITGAFGNAAEGSAVAGWPGFLARISYIGGSGNDVVITVSAVPDIAVAGNGVDIANGDSTPNFADHTDFGGAQLDGVTVERNFIISNSGTVDLNLTSAVTLSGANSADFSVTMQPGSPIAPASTSFFTLSFDPSAAGVRTATVSIASDDPDEAPFTFAIQGSDPNFDRISEAGADGDDTVDATRPAVASGGGRFLVVWSEPAGIYGQFVSEDNGTIGPDFEISTDPGAGRVPQRGYPDVVYNSTDSQWLVVWQENTNPGGATEYEIMAQVLDANGVKLSSPATRVSDMGSDGDATKDAFEPAVAYDSANNQYLVVWSGDDAVDSDEEIYGQLLAADLLEAGANDFRISDMGATEGDPAHQAQLPDVVFNESNGEFLVVWEGDDAADGEFGIFGQLVSTVGTESGADFAVGSAPAHDVTVVVDQDIAGYFVFWEGASQIHGQRLDDSGVEIGADDFVVSNMAVEAINPTVTASPSRVEVYVFWEGDNGGGELEIYRQTLTGSGALLGAPVQVSDQGPAGDANYSAQTPAAAIGQHNFAVWSGDTNGGSLVDEEFEIFGALSIVPPNLLINEVDVDQINASPDLEEFIELRNASGRTVNLDLWELRLSTGAVIDLPDVDLVSQDYFVICTNGGRTPNCDLDITPDTDLLSDAPAGIALFYNGILVDSLGWEGFSTAPYVEGAAAPADPGGGQSFATLSRLPINTQDNSLDFAVRCATPGLANSASAAGCTNPLVADLAISASDSPDPISTGQTLTYTVSVSNAGPHTAVAVQMNLVLPTGLDFVAASGTGWTCNDIGGVVSCTVSSLAIGAANNITITGTYNGAAGILDTNANVSSWAHDPDFFNNSAAISTAGEPEIAVSGNGNDIADGSVATSAANLTNFGSLPVGQTAQATYSVANVGGQPLTLDAASLAASLAASTEFNLLASFGSTTLAANDAAPGGSDETTFQVQYAPTSVGAHNQVVSFANSDADENPFNFTIRGFAVSVPVETGDGVRIVEAGVTDSYSVALGTTPADAVEVTATADGQSELSLDGINFSASVAMSFTDTTPQTVTVRAIDDGTFEGLHSSTISHAITSTADPTNYPLTFVIDDVVAAVGDDDGADITVHNADGTVEIVDGDSSPDTLDGTDFGPNPVNSSDFLIGNIQTPDLTFPANAITITGPHAGDFQVLVQPVGPIANGANELVTISFQPTAAGPRTATVNIANSDSSEDPFRFAIAGTANIRIVVTTLSDEDDGTPDPAVGAGCSLREAINWANSVDAPGSDVIGFQTGLVGTVLLNSRLPIITEALTIDGNTDNNVASEDIVIDGFGLYRVLQVDDADLTLRNLRIQNGYADGSDASGVNGGGIWANHSSMTPALSLDRVHISQSTADEGGAIFQQNGLLFAHNSSFTDNISGATAPNAGGAVRVVSSLADFLVVGFASCTFESNISLTSGGAVSLDAANSNLTFDNTFFTQNSAFENGNAVHIEDSNAGVDGVVHMQLNSCYLAFNSGGNGTVHAELTGNDRLEVSVEQSCFFDNEATDGAAGAVLISGSNGSYDFSNSTFADNEVNGAEAFAGALLAMNGTTTLANCSIYNNIGLGSNSSNIGVLGGIDASGGIVLINNTMIANNSGAPGASGNADEIRVRSGGIFIDANYNLVRGSTSNANLVQANNIIGQDPLVDPLTGGSNIGAPNSVDQMFILEPRNVSPLVNAGNSSYTVDQISNSRPIGLAPDIGAIESTQIGELQISGNGSSIVNGSTTPNTADGSDFGATSVVTGSVLRTFEIEGLGPNLVTLTGSPLVDITGAHAADFVVTIDPASQLFQGETTTFEITFDPSAAGVRSATVSIPNTDGDDNPFTFDISGIGSIGLVIVESGGTTDVTEGGATDTIAIGLDAAPVAPVTVEVVPGSQLDVGSGVGLGLTLVFSDTTTQVVTITADDDSISEGDHADTLNYSVTISNPADTVTGDDVVTTVNISDNDSEIAVSGNGQDIPNGAVDIQFADHTDFGATRTGSGQVVRSFTISNPVDTPLTFGTVTLSGPAAGDFSIIQQPSGPLANSASTDLIIGFTASADGTRDAIVSIPNNDPDENPFTFSISGHGNGNDIVFVDSNASGANDGSSFVNAFNYLQDALAYASAPVGIDHIWVAGTHRPDQNTANPGGTGDINATFTLLDLNMLGGFDGTERLESQRNPATKPTILSGDLGGANQSGPIADASSTGATALVDGFVFEFGASKGPDEGAHVSFDGGQATLRGCVFRDSPNTAIGVRGGAPVIDRCVFIDSLLGVVASDGNSDIRNCRFLHVDVAIYSEATADLAVSNSAFSGSASAIYGASGTLTVTNCSFANNVTAIENAGALLIVTNVVTSGNGNGLVTTGGTTAASYSNFAEAAVAGPGNISIDPLFRDADGADDTAGTIDDDLRIDAGSPAIDVGNDSAATNLGLTTDLEGNPRIHDDSGVSDGAGGTVDMGAYEFQGTTPTGIAVTGNGANIVNGDTSPNRADHTDFLAADMGGSPERTFSIENRGAAQLNISGISITGAHAGDFSVTASGLNSLNPGASTSFTVEFVPTALGPRNATVSIANSDSGDNPYTFAITGYGTLGVTFVKRNVVGGAADGSSWIDAFPHLQDALAAGAGNIWAAGTHRPDESAASPAGSGDSNAVFTLNSGRIVGGFAGWEGSITQSNPDQWPTVLSGDLNADDPTSIADNSGSIVVAGTDSYTLQNLTISGAQNTALTSQAAPLMLTGVTLRSNNGNNGGGMYNDGTAIAYNCRFLGNSANVGGAIFNNDTLELLNCTIANNSASVAGGALGIMTSATIANSIFASNTAPADPHVSGVASVSYSSFTGAALAGAGNIVADPLFVNLAADNVALQSTSPCIDAGDNDAVFAADLRTDIIGNFRVQDLSAAPNTGNGGAPIVDIGAYEYAGNVLFDYGDAPDPTYPTALFSDGARHIITGPVLGTLVDPDTDGQPTASSNGDDNDGSDDDDGVSIVGTPTPNQSVAVDVTVSLNPGVLSVWIDGDQNGDFSGADEQVVTDLALGTGLTTISIPIPGSFLTGTTVARFRLAAGGGLDATGAATSGEVEDHRITIANSAPVAVDDSATVAHNDSVSGDVLDNDSDPNGDVISVSAVNGAGGNVGVLLTLGSGAQVTVDANGAFIYDSNGAWNHLAVGQTGNDSFVYTVSDGIDSDTANVAVVITGVSIDADAVIPGVPDGSLDDFALYLDGADVVATRDGAELLRQDSSLLNSVTFNGSADDSRLTVDFSGGDPLASLAFAVFNGGQGADTLTLTGTTFSSQGIHHVSQDGDGFSGFCMLDGSRLDFTGLSPLNIARSVNTTIFLPDFNNSDAVLAPAGTGRFQLTGSTFEDTAGPNPSGSLTIDLGDAGNALSLNGLSSFSADLVVLEGAGTDAIRVDATLQTNGGAVTIAGDSIVVSRAISTGGGDVALNANDGITLVGSTGDINTGGGSYTADADANDNDVGAYSQSSQNATVETSGGLISITAADFVLGGTIAADSGDVELIPSLNQSIDLGASAGSDILIADSHADRIVASNLTIGNGSVAAVTVVTTFSPGAISNSLTILADGPIFGLAALDLVAPSIALFSNSNSISDGVEPIDLQTPSFQAVSPGDVYISSRTPALVDIVAGNDIFIEAVDLTIAGLSAFGLLDITPLLPSATIGLGGAVGDLDLDDADLANISANFAEIYIGSFATTQIAIETATFQSTVNLLADRIIDSVNAPDVSLAPATALYLEGTIAPGASPGNFDVDGHVELVGSTLEIEMVSPADTPGANLDLLSATTINIQGGVTLDATWTGAAPTPGQAIQFIATTSLTGNFAGLPAGSPYLASGQGFFLEYAAIGAAFIANTPPGAVDDSVAVAVGNVANIDVLANDGDVDSGPYGDSFTATALAGDPANIGVPVTLPSNAIVTLLSDGSFSYDTNGQFASLDAGETATDSVTYTITDILDGTSVATVHVTIHGAGDPPVAVDDAISANEDSQRIGGGLLGNDSDPEGNAFAVTVHDAVSGLGANVTVDAAGNYTYDPRVSPTLQTLALGASRTDSFSYTIADLTGNDSANVIVTVHGANDAPVAADDSDATGEDSVLFSGGILTNDSDIDVGDTLAARAETIASGRGGSVTIAANGSFSYDGTGVASLQALAAGEQATDSFTYTLVDNNGATDQASVVITVTGQNDAPVAGDDSRTVNEDSPLNGSGLLANDSDVDSNDTHTADVAAGLSARGANYSVTATGDFSYDGGQAAFAQPLAAGESTTDSFTYIVRDNNNGTDRGTVVVTIYGQNDAPVAVADSAAVLENGFLNGASVLANDTDSDNGASLSVSAADANSARGVPLTVNPGGTFVYDITGSTTFDYLAVGERGTDSFTYAASDGSSTDRATVVITITGINDPLTANDDTYSTREDSALSGSTVFGNDVDPDLRDVLRINSADTSSALGAHVAVNPLTGSFLYDPQFVAVISALNTGETLHDTFTYEATDNRGSFDSAIVTIIVHGENDAPLANIGGPYVGLEGTPLTLSAAGSTDPNNNITGYFWDFDNDGSYDDASGVTVSFNNPQDGVYNIGLRVVDATGFSDVDSTTVTLSNVAPIADAGGPYVGAASSVIAISGAGSIDPGQDIASYEWDLDDDGAFDDVFTRDTTFSSPFGGTFPIHLRVTDANGESSSDTTTVVTNLKITWENLVGVTTFGSQGENLRKTTGGSWNAGASSVQTLDEDGYLRIFHRLSSGKRMVGLSTAERGPHFTSIEYALYLNYGNVEIYENGVHRGGFGPSLGQELRIEVKNGDIIYWRGNSELRRVVGVVNEPFSFVADASLSTLNSTIQDAELVVPPPQNPLILAYEASDPDNGNTFYSKDDQVCVTFHQKTNMGGYALNQPLSQAQIDKLVTFIPAPGIAYTGYWAAKDKLVVNIATASLVEPVLGSAFCVPAGFTPIFHEKAPLQAPPTNSPGLAGNWGSIFVKWVQGVNVRIEGNLLRRATANPDLWDGGAVSSREISGDVYMETIVTARGKHRMIGLGNGNSSAHFNDIEYAFFLHRAGGLEGYESGIQVGGMGSYQAGDILRIEIVGTTLRYLKNSVVLRTVTINPDTLFPVRVDTSINDNGGDFNNTIFVAPDPPPPAIASFVASDPDNDVIGYNAGDVFTINFTHPTTMPAGAISDLFTFSQPLGATLTGGWLDNQTYQVTVVAAGAAPTIGVATAAPAGTIPIYHDNSRVLADNTPATLSGKYGRVRNKITVAQVSASSISGGSAQAIVNGSGLNTDQHDSNGANMWLSASETNPSVTVDLGRLYYVSEMALWNYNASGNGNLGFTATTIERSLDGSTWTPVFNGNIPQAAGAGSISPTRYFILDANTRYVRVSATGDGPLGLSELCFFSDQALPPFRWDDAGLQATISDGKLQASFQAGHLFDLRNLNNAHILLQNTPGSLPGVINLFSGAAVDLSTAVVNVSATGTTATFNYLWLDGSSWTLNWAFSGGDLLCTTSAVTNAPVTEMSLNFFGADIANYSCVTIDEFGFSHEMDAPFNGPQWAPGDSQPAIALFDGTGAAWAIEGRGAGYIMPIGSTATADLIVSQPLAATTTPSLFDIRIRCGTSWQGVAQAHRDWIAANAAALPAAAPHICHSLVANGAGPGTTVGPLASEFDIADARAQGVGRIIADTDYVLASLALSAGADILYVSDRNLLPFFATNFPGVPLMSQDFNPDSLQLAALALIELPPGHPLAGYLFSPIAEFFGTGQMYAPTAPADLDAHIRWPYFVPGSDPSEPGHNSWSEILDIFHQHSLVSDTTGAYVGMGVTAQWVSTATTRYLELNPAGSRHGLRHTNTQSVDLGGGAIEGWLAYNGTNMFGLNPARTYYVDPLLSLDPLAFHIDSAPGNFVVNDQTTLGEFNRVEFSGNGTLTYVLPADFSAYLDNTQVAGPTLINGSHTLRAFAHSPQFFEGLWTNLIVDGNRLSNSVIRGRFPAGASSIRVLVDYVNYSTSRGIISINGTEIINSVNSTPFNIDISAFTGQDVVVDLQLTGDGEWDSILFQVTGAPVAADIGGPYSTPEGTGIDLDAGNSYPTGVSTGWDLDNGGSFDDAFGQTVNFARTQSGVYPIGIEVDNGVSTDQAFGTVTVTNVAPTADAGGPYLVAPGDGIVLDGSNSNDPGLDITDYDWDYDGDGNFNDATGPTPVFTPLASGTLTIYLRVTDADGASSSGSATVFASNDVEWTNFVNSEVQGDCLVKIGGGSAWNAGASTVGALTEDGYLGINANRGGKRMIGLNTTDTNAHLSDIDYAFYMNQSAIEIYESGVQRGSFGTFAEGADLRIYLSRGDVYYTIDGVEVRRNVGVIPLEGFSFVADASIETLGADVCGVRMVTPPPESPRIILYEGTDPDNLSTAYETNDAINIVFHQKTDRGGSAVNQVLPRATVDQLFTLSPPPALDYDGKWISDDTFQIRIITSAAVPPAFGSASVQVAGTIVINNAKVPLPATGDVALLTGHWGTVVVLWTNPVNVLVDGNKLTRPSNSEGWDGGAASSRTFTGDGYMETIAETTGKSRMIGFSDGDDNQHFSSLNFAFLMHVSGSLEVYENGVQRGRLTTYKAGDVLRLEREGTAMKYMVNGLVYRSVPVSDTLGLKVDCSLYSRGAIINNTRLVLPGDPVSRAAASEPIRTAATILLDSGWNLVSLPVQPDDSDPASVFGGPVQGIDGPADSLEAGGGYWVFNAGAARSVVITGEAPSETTLPVASGWSLFGPVADFADPAALEGATIYSFENGAYRQLDSGDILHATQGYLIHRQ